MAVAADVDTVAAETFYRAVGDREVRTSADLDSAPRTERDGSAADGLAMTVVESECRFLLPAKTDFGVVIQGNKVELPGRCIKPPFAGGIEEGLVVDRVIATVLRPPRGFANAERMLILETDRAVGVDAVNAKSFEGPVISPVAGQRVASLPWQICRGNVVLALEGPEALVRFSRDPHWLIAAEDPRVFGPHMPAAGIIAVEVTALDVDDGNRRENQSSKHTACTSMPSPAPMSSIFSLVLPLRDS